MSLAIPPRSTPLAGVVMALACGFCGAAATGAATVPPEPEGAEFAIRWDTAAAGSPRTPEAVLRALGLKASDLDRKTKTYQVQYFEMSEPPQPMPAGFDGILRKRTEGDKAELTFKYRWTDKSQPARPLGKWTCPLDPAPGKPGPTLENEVDFSFVAEGSQHKTFSHSCSVKSPAEAWQPPAKFAAKALPCHGEMVRRKVIDKDQDDDNDLKIETWTLPKGRTVMEVSRKGLNRQADLDAFRREIVTRLLKTGLVPLDESKSTLGSDCT